MTASLTPEKLAERRTRILDAARYCFFNFGFAKTSIDDVAKRAGISRTLIYKDFRDKEDLITSVFVDWLVSRHPAALAAASGSEPPAARLHEVCRLLVLDPYREMVGAPMANEIFEVCDRFEPAVTDGHRNVVRSCAEAVLGHSEAAEVFVLALDGMLADGPTEESLARRVELLIARFVSV